MVVRNIKKLLGLDRPIPTEYLSDEGVSVLTPRQIEKIENVKVMRVQKNQQLDTFHTTLDKYLFVLIDVKPIANDMDELRRTVTKLKLAAKRAGGELVGLDHNWLLAISNRLEYKKETF